MPFKINLLYNTFSGLFIMNIAHTSVMPNEVLSFLPNNSKIAVDATLGEGGHTKLLLEKGLDVHAFDRDSVIIEKAKQRLNNNNQLHTYNQKYDNIYNSLPKEMLGNIDFMLFDLGVSMFHFKEASRGFSFSENTALDMRLGLNEKNAFDIVNGYREEDLVRVFQNYGEIKYSKTLARAIVESRKSKQIETTDELENIVFHATPKNLRHTNTHHATKVFQSIRIEVNDEIGILENAIKFVPKILKHGGVVVFMSYHSLEDRVVKQYLKENENTKNKVGIFNILTRRPLVASEEEIATNKASRSVKVRAASLV